MIDCGNDTEWVEKWLKHNEQLLDNQFKGYLCKDYGKTN